LITSTILFKIETVKKSFRQLKIPAFAAAAGVIVAAVCYYNGCLNKPHYLFTVLGLIIPFFCMQYCLLIKHCQSCYLENYRFPGSYKKIILFFLFIEPIGPFRFFYYIKQVRPYLKDKKRYAYTKDKYKVKLKDLKVLFFQSDINSKKGYSVKEISVEEHPVYCYLKTGDKNIFIDYHSRGKRKNRYSKKKHPNPCSIKKFDDLYRKIRDKQFKNNNPIRVKGTVISDGMHRACVFYYLYGSEFEVNVIYNKFHPVPK